LGKNDKNGPNIAQNWDLFLRHFILE
jgi:hypothetical protein